MKEKHSTQVVFLSKWKKKLVCMWCMEHEDESWTTTTGSGSNRNTSRTTDSLQIHDQSTRNSSKSGSKSRS
jgi:hypothetical protein